MNEMEKLRKLLDSMGIKWRDMSSIYPQDKQYSIYRTKFTVNGVKYSVVYGVCTYGGEYGMLEMMVGDAEPKGWLTAEDIIGVIQEKIMKE
jgi:hypothetical protein